VGLCATKIDKNQKQVIRSFRLGVKLKLTWIAPRLLGI
jgi:hypothetical protein